MKAADLKRLAPRVQKAAVVQGCLEPKKQKLKLEIQLH